MNNQKRFFLVIVGIMLLLTIAASGTYYLRIKSNKQSFQNQIVNTAPSPTITEPVNNARPPLTDKPRNTLLVRIVLGDIVVAKNGKDTKITAWGYNASPLLSPDQNRIAYLSKSNESLENEKVDQGYKRTSSNVWIINVDGTNPVKVTNHIDFVYRGNLHWIDNNRLLFVDGEQTARIYNVATNSFQTVMGPEKAVQACLDACGYETRYFYNPDYTYLIRLNAGGGGAGIPSKTAILNIQTLQSQEINDRFGVNFDTISFPTNTILTFQGSNVPNYDKRIQVTINLANQHVEIQ